MAAVAAPTRTPLPLAPVGAKLGHNIDYELFMDCVHCGLCLGSCPTYVETGNENDSPRGRIYLWRAVTDGRIQLDDEVRHHLDLCLDCRACETACPSGVQYGRIIGSYKKDLAKLLPPAPTLSRLQGWMLFNLTPYASRMRMALAPMRMLQRIGLGKVARGISRFLPHSLRLMQEIVPDLQPHYGQLPEVLEAVGPRRARVALFLGCAADAFFPQTNLATARVLQQNGCDVWIPRGQVCCGALHYHSGFVEPALQFAASNCAEFETRLPDGWDTVDAIINNAGGCGPVLKEYGRLLENTPGAGRATTFAKKVRDVSEFLIELGPLKPQHPLPMKATYHDACGLCHAQKIRRPPRQLLEMIPGLELVPLPESEHCCGAAGSYNITQPEMAHDLGLRKTQNIVATGAKAVFAGNVGCLLQIGRHLRWQHTDIWVAHPIDALWASYSGKR
jgi:glycolate oxidase iron-sulfur subunit